MCCVFWLVLLACIWLSSSKSTEVRVSVYKTDDRGTYMDYSNETNKKDVDILRFLEEDLHDKVKQLLDDNWFVQTSNPETEEIYDKQALVDGSAIVSAPENATRVKFDILKGDMLVDSISKDLPQWQEAQGFLIRDKAQ